MQGGPVGATGSAGSRRVDRWGWVGQRLRAALEEQLGAGVPLRHLGVIAAA